MDDRDKRIGDLQARLDAMSEEEREEARTFLARFDQQVDAKVEQLLYETQPPRRLSEEDRRMRARLREGEVPLLDEDGERYYKPRDQLTLQDMQRFGAFMDSERRRYEREIGDLGESSEN